MPLFTFTVPEAEISVFPVNSDGAADTSSPLWIGASASNIHLIDSLEEVIDRPSGASHPEVHHGAESHSITIGRIWETQVSDVAPPDNLSLLLAAADLVNNPPAVNAIDYRLLPNQTYVVVIKWEDADNPDRFMYRVYYNVTDQSMELNGDLESEQSATHKWSAQYYR